MVCVEPCFDAPWKIAQELGVVRKGVSLRPRGPAGELRSAADLVLHLDELDSSITPSTRILFLNTPHNPTGKVSLAKRVGLGAVPPPPKVTWPHAAPPSPRLSAAHSEGLHPDRARGDRRCCGSTSQFACGER